MHDSHHHHHAATSHNAPDSPPQAVVCEVMKNVPVDPDTALSQGLVKVQNGERKYFCCQSCLDSYLDRLKASDRKTS
jgi:hypothetical protein